MDENTSAAALHPLFAGLGMKYPILQAPTGSIAGPELAAAVAGAGGMGAMSPYRLDPQTAANQVRQVRTLTPGAFQVNFVLITPPQALAAVLEAGAPVITFSWGDPAPYLEQAHAAGAITGVQVTNVAGARRALDAGADFLICQGVEAGGHVQSSTPLLELLPLVVAESAGAPVVASGGIGDGAAIAKALALGAAGAILGTRFVATHESRAHPLYKEAIARASTTDSSLTVCFDGGWPQAAHRVLRNRTLENWEAAGSPMAGRRPGENDVVARREGGQPILRYADTAPRATMKGDIAQMALYAGQSCGAIHDIPSASELVERLWAECQAARGGSRLRQ